MADIEPVVRADDDPRKVRAGETGTQYIARMHREHPVSGQVGRTARPSNTCTCPRAYSRCRWAVEYDRQRGDHSLGHGGWGW